MAADAELETAQPPGARAVEAELPEAARMDVAVAIEHGEGVVELEDVRRSSALSSLARIA